MFVIVGGILFWLLTIMVVIRLLWIGTPKWPPTGRQIMLWIAVAAVAVGIYFRPHEDILGGQDGGAYLSFGARLARDPHLRYQDTLLNQVPINARDDFLLYGHTRPYLSKFACGRIVDFERAIATPWFQPAYPVVMSIPARVGGIHWIFYVVPLFTILTGLALRAVAQLAFKHRWSGAAAMALYLASPLVIWQGRNPRPEIIASFLLFSGAALLFRAWHRNALRKAKLDNEKSIQNLLHGKNRRGIPAWIDVVLGATCISLAPFFHVTAWMATVPAAMIVIVAIINGRTAFLVYPLIAVAGLALFIYQSLIITSIYSLHRFIIPAKEYGHWLLALGVSGLMVLSTLSWWRRQQNVRIQLAGIAPSPAWPYTRWTIAILTLAAVGVCAALTFTVGRPENMPVPVYHYIYRTDLLAVANMISLPVGLLALAGLVSMALAIHPGSIVRRTLLVFALPGALLIGNIYDLFTTRYMLTLVMPVVTLGMTALVCRISDDDARRPVVIGLITILALLGLRERLPLVAVTENRGLTHYLELRAQVIKTENGMLLGEYARIMSPFDHLFGIPTLAMPMERLDDYSRAEEAWAHIMRLNPERPAFFATPCQTPVSDRFIFTPVTIPGPTVLDGERLPSARWDLPRTVQNSRTELKLYRMRPRPAITTPSTPVAWHANLEAGNMGFRRFNTVLDRIMLLDGITLNRNNPIELKLPPACMATGTLHRGWLALGMDARASRSPASVRLTCGTNSITAPIVDIGQGLWAARVDANLLPASDAALRVTADAPLVLLDLAFLSRHDTLSLFDHIPPGLSQQHQLPLTARWARQDAGVFLDAPLAGTALVAMLAIAPGELDAPITLGFSTGPSSTPLTRKAPPGHWRWHILPAADLGGIQITAHHWLTIHADRTYNPQHARRPSDLAVLVGYVGVVP